jgi:hypothetical protein
MMRIKVMLAGSILALGTALPISPAVSADHHDQPFANARSLCSESGFNDPEEDSELERQFGDPGGLVQSFGYALGWGGIHDPENFDPRTGRGTAMPGFYCNPTRFDFSDPDE